MSYLSELRKFVGNRPLLMVGATVFILNDKNQLLLLERVDNHCWGPPGGAVEPGEVVEDSAKREAFEETGLELGELTLFGVFSGNNQFYRYPNGDEVYNVTITYLARVPDGEIHISPEHTDWKYFLLNEIPSEISPPIIPILKKFLAEIQVKP
jgi:ADP-ribose pyrophosphatase YjhB (NUDIX family)